MEINQLPHGLTPLELTAAETVDDLETLAWWHETQRRDANLWARRLPARFGLALIDAGLTVTQLARLARPARMRRAAAALPQHPGSPAHPHPHPHPHHLLMRLLEAEVPGLVAPTYTAILNAARSWQRWPLEYRQAMIVRYGVHDGPSSRERELALQAPPAPAPAPAVMTPGATLKQKNGEASHHG